MIAVAVVGEKNITKITGLRPLSEQSLASLARVVAGKREGHTYYVYECSERGAQAKKGDPLYVWHVGDGFSHADGWWVEVS